MKNWLGFGDLALIFKVTAGLNLPNLSPKCLCAPYLMNWLADFNQICMNITSWWIMMKSWFDFSDLDLFFKVSARLKLPNLSQKVLVCRISHEQLADFNQTCMAITFGHDKSWIGFGDINLIFKVIVRLNPPKLSQKVFVCILSHGPLDRMLPNLQAYINRTGSIAY